MENDLTLKQLRFAQWYLSHKRRFYRMLIGLMIVVDFIFWGLALYQFVVYIFLSESHELMLRELTVDRIDYLSFHKHFAPDDLIVDSQILIQYPGSRQYDLVAKIKNPNSQWRIPLVEYYFSLDGEKTEIKKDFILPNQEKYFLVFRQELGIKPSNFEVNFLKIDWQRVRPDKQASLQILSEIEVGDIELGFAVPEQKMVSLPRVSFKIKNQSIYSFWQVNFIVILYQGNQIVGVNTLPVKKLLGNEQRQVELMWPSIPYSTEIGVIPDVDIFDQSNFMSLTQQQ